MVIYIQTLFVFLSTLKFDWIQSHIKHFDMILMARLLIFFYIFFCWIKFSCKFSLERIIFLNFFHFFHLIVESLIFIRWPFFKYFHITPTNIVYCLNNFKRIIMRLFSSLNLDILTISSFNKSLFLFFNFWVGNKFNLQFFRDWT